jgi:hypothetical protein
MAAMQSFHSLAAGPLPKLNGALLTLLPKKEAPELRGDYCPIILIHSFAKLACKTLALSLPPYIDALVSNAQSAFIKRRCIQNNYLYVSNLARAYHRKRQPALLLKPRKHSTLFPGNTCWSCCKTAAFRRGGGTGCRCSFPPLRPQ